MLCPAPAAPAVPSKTPGLAEHVVVVVWDGMRPDFINPGYTPTLNQMVREGTLFRNHHAVYVSSTEVNGTALATGVYPNHSGIIANREYLPEINWLDSSATESVDTIRRGDGLTYGQYLAVPTLAEILHGTGIATAIAGTKPVTLLQDRSNQRLTLAAALSAMLYNGHTLPAGLLPEMIQINGKECPTNATPNTARDAWTVKGLTQVLWKHGVPKFSLLWLSEPDASQHAKSPGSPTAIAALAGNDHHLAAIFKALEAKGVREKTDVFVVSDHGFSSVQRGADVEGVLKKAKFKAGKKLDDPESGEVLMVSLGGSILFYVIEHNESATRNLVQLLQGEDFTGVIFCRLALPGTFPLAQVHLDTNRTQPDVVLSMRWASQTNEFGIPGTLVAESGRKGTGAHGSLSPYELHNTLVASGPDFRRGWIDDLPTGNTDLAPTILHLLGILIPSHMDGRVFSEALNTGAAATIQPEFHTVEAHANLGSKHWRQYMQFSIFDKQKYFDEGNGELLP